jgi:hypothetical protein
MWIVRIALDRPYTFVVLALLILILSPLVILETPTDIFPNINIPAVAVGFTYTRLISGGDGGSDHHRLRALFNHVGRQTSSTSSRPAITVLQ